MSVADALRMANAGLDYLNGPGAVELDAAAYGSVLRSLGEVQAKFTAAHAAVLSRFDAADAPTSASSSDSASATRTASKRLSQVPCTSATLLTLTGVVKRFMSRERFKRS